MPFNQVDLDTVKATLENLRNNKPLPPTQPTGANWDALFETLSDGSKNLLSEQDLIDAFPDYNNDLISWRNAHAQWISDYANSKIEREALISLRDTEQGENENDRLSIIMSLIHEENFDLDICCQAAGVDNKGALSRFNIQDLQLLNTEFLS